MIGGSTSSSTNSGAKLTRGRPGNSASATPVNTSRIAGGILSRLAATAIAATTTIRAISTSIFSIKRAPPSCRAKFGPAAVAPAVSYRHDETDRYLGQPAPGVVQHRAVARGGESDAARGHIGDQDSARHPALRRRS